MKKTILTIVAMLIANVFFGQWTKHNYVDDFGDETENEYKAMIAYGTFSNSATQNSKLMCKLIDNFEDESLTVYVYEYARSLATSIESLYLTVKIKDPNSEIHTIKRVFYSKTGVLLFSNKQYKQFMEIIKNPGEYTMIFDIASSYSRSSYKVKIAIE